MVPTAMFLLMSPFSRTRRFISFMLRPCSSTMDANSRSENFRLFSREMRIVDWDKISPPIRAENNSPIALTCLIDILVDRFQVASSDFVAAIDPFGISDEWGLLSALFRKNRKNSLHEPTTIHHSVLQPTTQRRTFHTPLALLATFTVTQALWNSSI